MKKILILLAIFGILQTTVAQQKKNIATKTGGKNMQTPAKKTLNSQNTPQKATNKKENKSQAFKKGDILLNAGVGLTGVGFPIGAGVDYFITDDISVGAEGYYNRLDSGFFAGQFKYTVIGIGANGNYHFGRILKIPAKWDVYAGVSITYIIVTYDDSTNENLNYGTSDLVDS